MSTYEIIKNLPGKGFNWTGFVSALRAEYVTACDPQQKDNLRALCRWDQAKGVRQLREAAMGMACSIADKKSKQSKFIDASPETKEWGGFLGGEVVVWTNEAALEAATSEIAKMSATFKVAA